MSDLIRHSVLFVKKNIRQKTGIDEEDKLSYEGLMEPGEIIFEKLEENKREGKHPATVEALARMVGMLGDTLRKKLKGGEKGRGFRPSELTKIAEALSLPKACLFGEKPRVFEPIQPVITILGRFNNIPEAVRSEEYLATPLVEGEIAAGFPAEIPEEYVTGMVWVYKPEIGKRQDHNLRAVKLRKDATSMVPLIRPRDIVIIDPTEIPPFKPLSKNAIYAVRVEREGGFTLKKVREVDNFWVFISENPEKDPILISKDKVENPFVGRVIWSWTSWVR